MRIKKLKIYGYGKWVDQEFDLNNGIEIFLGKNEAGKSTLMSFIHSILFGFPTRNSTLLRYEPLESSRYGGQIIAEDQQFGEVIIERVHGKVTGDVSVTLEDGTTGADALLTKVLKGINRENFQNIYSFTLSDIENVHQLNKNKLSRYLLNIGAHSTDYYLDLVDDFKKRAYDLYRPSGRIPPLNKQLTIIKEQEKKLAKIEARNESYLELIDQSNEQNQDLNKFEQKKEVLNDKIKKHEELEKNIHLLEEIEELEEKIKNTKLPRLKKDGLYLLEEKQKNIKNIREDLNVLSKKMKSKKKNIIKADVIENYYENEKEIKNLEESLPDKISELESLRRIEKEIQEQSDRYIKLKSLLNIGKESPTLIRFTSKEKLRNKELLNKLDELEIKMERNTNDLEKLKVEIEQKNEKADYYEELMWSQEYFAKIESQIMKKGKESVKSPVKKGKGLLNFLGIAGLLFLFLSVFISSTSWIFTATIGVIFIGMFFFYRQSKNKKQLTGVDESEESYAIMVKEYKNQQAIQSDWQNLLAEIDAVQMDYQDKKKEKENLLKLENELINHWERLLIKHNIPAIHSIKKAGELMVLVEEFIEVEELIKKLKDKKESLASKLVKDFSMIDNFIKENRQLNLTEKIESFRQYLKEMNHLLQIEESNMSELNRDRQRKKELLNHKEKLAIEIEHLLDSAGVKSIEEFYLLYKKKEKLEKNKSRLNFLTENIPGYDLNEKIPTKKERTMTFEKITAELKELNKKIKRKIDERAKTKVLIQELEKDGHYSEVLQDFEIQKARTQSLVDEWISDKLAESIIQSTLNQVTRDRFDEIIQEINQYFAFLTNGNYTNVLFKEEELLVQNKKGRVIELKTLSRGTAEPLYVAIRLAYIVNMQDVIKLPVIMDDPFVNFDKERKEKVNRLLNKLSDKLQIIYFSFDTDLEKEFEECQITKLKE